MRLLHIARQRQRRIDGTYNRIFSSRNYLIYSEISYPKKVSNFHGSNFYHFKFYCFGSTPLAQGVIMEKLMLHRGRQEFVKMIWVLLAKFG